MFPRKIQREVSCLCVEFSASLAGLDYHYGNGGCSLLIPLSPRIFFKVLRLMGVATTYISVASTALGRIPILTGNPLLVKNSVCSVNLS